MRASVEGSTAQVIDQPAYKSFQFFSLPDNQEAEKLAQIYNLTFKLSFSQKDWGSSEAV